MAGRRYIDLITDLETIANLTGQRAMVRRLVIDGVAAIASAWDWSWLWTEDFFSSVAEYATGTVSVTNGSTTVTGTNTVWTSSMVGRKFRISGQQAFYRISAVGSSTGLTLTQPFQGATASAQTYSLYKDTFLLRADIDKQKLTRQLQNGVALLSVHASEFDVAIPTPTSLGSATVEVLIGRNTDDPLGVANYTTGTVSMASGSRTLTGSGTSWTTAEGVSRGTKIQIGTLLFTVRSVDSNTQITTYEAAGSAIAAATTYTAVLDNLKVQLYTIPNVVENYAYRFQRLPGVLDADQDYPELLPVLHPLIMRWALPWLWEHKGFYDRALAAKKLYDDEVADAIRRYGHLHQDRLYRKHPRDLSRDLRTAQFPSNVGATVNLL